MVTDTSCMSQEGGLSQSTLVCLMCYLDEEQDKNLALNNLQAWKHVFVQEMLASQAVHGSKRWAQDAKAGKQLGVVCIRCPRELRGDEPSCLCPLCTRTPQRWGTPSLVAPVEAAGRLW